MKPLLDPLGDRAVPSVTAPPHQPLMHSYLYPEDGKPDWRILKSHLQQEGRVTKEDLLNLVSDVSALFKKEPNLLYMDDPVTVVGDIHGQYYDLLRLLELGGDPANCKYLFLGDYVDRGSFSIEVILLLFALKINYPETIFMIRGNHECRQMTTFFNFRNECLYKYDLEVYERIMECFDCLPLACVLNERFLSVHGGISPDLHSLEDLNRIYRFLEPPRQGLFCDLLWSDPVDAPDGHLGTSFKSNSVRGCSHYYGADAVNNFVNRNDLIGIIRAHEAQLDGYKMHKWNGPNEFPLVITLFSAPNYCDVYNNKGAIIKFDNNTLNIQQYTYTPHPYLLPDYMDIFTWSIPFVTEKVTEMLFHILKPQPNESSPVHSEYSKRFLSDIEEEIKQSEIDSLEDKIKTLSKMTQVFRALREDNEAIMQLKGMCPDDKVPRGVFAAGRSALQGAVEDFEQAKSVDTVNEKRPGN